MIPTNPIPEVPNYGSSAIYRDLPSEEQIRAGVIPLDSLPAAWWNAMWACTNTAVNDARSAVGTLINEICNAITGAGICINESCIDQLYQAIDTIRQRIGNAVTAGAVKSSSCCGEVSIDANGIMTANGVGNAAQLNTTSKVVVGAINELKSTYDCCLSDLSGCIGSVDNSKAPTSHVSSATTYGVGNADCYGHLKISDTYTSCVGAAADGVAASQQALYCVYCAISAAASLGNTKGCALGTAAAGTCTTAARSDHVHPKQTCVACAACGYNGSAYAAFGSNAFNSTAFTTCKGTVTVTNLAACNEDTPVALCTGVAAVGRSTGCTLTYNNCTGMLKAACFSGISCKAVCSTCANRTTVVANMFMISCCSSCLYIINQCNFAGIVTINAACCSCPGFSVVRCESGLYIAANSCLCVASYSYTMSSWCVPGVRLY